MSDEEKEYFLNLIRFRLLVSKKEITAPTHADIQNPRDLYIPQAKIGESVYIPKTQYQTLTHAKSMHRGMPARGISMMVS